MRARKAVQAFLFFSGPQFYAIMKNRKKHHGGSMGMKWRRGIIVLFLLAVMSMTVLSGCGGPDYDASVFVLPQTGLPSAVADEIEAKIQEYMGDQLTVGVVTSPIFQHEKLIVEVISATHSVMILPKDSVIAFLNQGGPIPLDEWFDRAEFEEGVLEGKILELDEKGKLVDEKTGTHLFAIPMNKTRLFRELGYKEDSLYAVIMANAPDKQLAVTILKAIVG
jgi:hypothetical protein